MSGWIQPGEQRFDFLPGHGGAAAGAGLGALPDVQENARAAAVLTRVGVVIHDDAQAILFANGAHFLGTVPIRRGGFGAVHYEIVIGGFDVIDTFDRRGQLRVGQPDGFRLGRLGEAERGTQAKNSGGTLAIAFVFDWAGEIGGWIETATPAEAVAADDHGEALNARMPGPVAAAALEQKHFAGNSVPILRHHHDELIAVRERGFGGLGECAAGDLQRQREEPDESKVPVHCGRVM